MTFAVTQAQVLNVLAHLHEVVPSRRPALKARVQHFQRLAFPAGVNTGKGKSARYEAAHIVQLVLAFELSQLGLWPEVVTTALRKLKNRLPDALARLSLDPDRERWFDVAVALDARALHDLAREFGEEGEPFRLEVLTLDQTPALVDTLKGDRRRTAVINLSAALAAAEQVLRKTEGDDFDFAAEVRAWADSAVVGGIVS